MTAGWSGVWEDVWEDLAERMEEAIAQGIADEGARARPDRLDVALWVADNLAGTGGPQRLRTLEHSGKLSRAQRSEIAWLRQGNYRETTRVLQRLRKRLGLDPGTGRWQPRPGGVLRERIARRRASDEDGRRP